MKTVTVTVGWTISDMPRYSSFDGYQPGEKQHTETLTFEVPESWDNERVAWALLSATNAPRVEGAGYVEALAALQATGYRGFEAHYSLSKGDTVTFEDGTSLAFTGYAVERVEVPA